MRWTATMDDGWTWTVTARTEAEALVKVAKEDREVLGRVRTPVKVERRGR